MKHAHAPLREINYESKDYVMAAEALRTVEVRARKLVH